MVYEMYVEDGITIDEIDARSGTLTMGKINSKMNGTATRSIIHFTKYTFASGFDDLDIDIKLRSKTDPQTTIYVLVYGVSGTQNDVEPLVWDRFYYIENQKIVFEAPIDMNRKDINDVNKIDVNGQIIANNQIDMKGNKIIEVGVGTENTDAVNKAQLVAVKSEVESKISDITDIVNTNTLRGRIITLSLEKLTYYYFTDQLRHNNSITVKFPAVDSDPYSADNNSEFFKIKLDGHYQIIYTDFYQKSGQFIIHDGTNGNDLFVTNLYNPSGWAPITINTVIPINTDNGFGYVRIKMYIKTTDNAIFDGAGYSTFYIKYLHS